MAIDPYGDYVVLQLPMNGSNGSTTFRDLSNAPKTITAYGNASISTAQSKWNGSSGYFDGSGDYLVVPTSVNWVLSSVAFSVELWFYPLNVSSADYVTLIHAGTYGSTDPWSINVKPTQLNCSPGANPYTVSVVDANSNPVTISNGNWYHVALVSTNGTSMNFYFNGVKQAESARGMYSDQSAMSIGASNWNNPMNYFMGYIQDLRITKGVARYTDSFSVPTESFQMPEPPGGIVVQHPKVQPFSFLPYGA